VVVRANPRWMKIPATGLAPTQVSNKVTGINPIKLSNQIFDFFGRGVFFLIDRNNRPASLKIRRTSPVNL